MAKNSEKQPLSQIKKQMKSTIIKSLTKSMEFKNIEKQKEKSLEVEEVSQIKSPLLDSESINMEKFKENSKKSLSINLSDDSSLSSDTSSIFEYIPK